MYMSRLAAIKEFSFMKALSERGLPVPQALAQNRHTIVMGLVDAFPLRQISSVPDPAGMYAELMDLILRLASLGLIHGDFNEFNILVKEEEGEEGEGHVEGRESATDIQQQQDQLRGSHTKLTPIIIDFPQMVSVDHPNAEFYFNRDVACIKRFFERRFHFLSDEPGPHFEDAKAQLRDNGTERIDVEVEASGFSRKMAKELEAYMKDLGVDGDRGGVVEGEEEESSGAAQPDLGEDVNEETETANESRHAQTEFEASGNPDHPG
jgi:RIO kinase 2